MNGDGSDSLYAVTHIQTLEFFALGLKDVSECEVDEQELLYNASVLAHYAQVSTEARVDLPAPKTLSDVFYHFVWSDTLRRDPGMMEAAGAQCLLLAGFFEEQMLRRHNIAWYASLGAGFFRRAANAGEKNPARSRLLVNLAEGFELWRQRHAKLSRELRDQQHLLYNLPKSSL